MSGHLKQDQEIINRFLNFLPSQTQIHLRKNAGNEFEDRSGSLTANDLSPKLKERLPEFFTSIALINESVRNLYNGDISTYENDRSRADFALATYLQKNSLSADEIDQVMRTSKLYRKKWDENRNQTTWLRQTITTAIATCNSELATPQLQPPISSAKLPSRLLGEKPTFIRGGMAARKFAGPQIDKALYLYPLRAITGIVALGSGGKTTLLLAHSAHIASGKAWNGSPIQRRKVIFLSVEESQEELNRKFSAITKDWSNEERGLAQENLLFVSLLGQDKRLVSNKFTEYTSSGVAEEIIELAKEFGLQDGVIILDHLQGFATGDLNHSETATSLSREANKIVDATGAAVVFAAHISKANISASSIEQGLAVGSLAFENAFRQLLGMICMPESDAKKYGLEDTRKQYIRLEAPKNSYGTSDGGIWLQKVPVQEYHTAAIIPVVLTPPIPASIRTAQERITEKILEKLKKDLYCTKNKLDALAGTEGIFKASKANLRNALNCAIEEGVVTIYQVTDTDREADGLPKQVKEVLRAAS